MSNGSRHSLAYVPETVYGTTPASPAFKALRHTGTTLGLSRETLQSEELRSDRMVASIRGGAQSVAGDIEGELSFTSYDDILAGVLCGTWAVDGGGTGIDRLKAGTTRHSYTLERNFGDIADKPYHRFTGVEFNTLDLSVAANSIAKIKLGVIGQGMTIGAAALASSSYAAAPTTEVMDSFTGQLTEGGVVLAMLTELSMNVTNNMESRFVVGSRNSLRPSIGRIIVSGNATAFFEDSTLLEKFLNETDSSLEFDLPDLAGNLLTVVVPKMRYMGGQPDVKGEGPILLTMPWQAMLDPATGTCLYFDRNPA